jgi:hypothetical protein
MLYSLFSEIPESKHVLLTGYPDALDVFLSILGNDVTVPQCMLGPVQIQTSLELILPSHPTQDIIIDEKAKA